jgi:hypothetical protein
MKTVAGLLMVANAGLFLFGAVQHAGVALGSFHEPVIIPAAIVETLCGLCLQRFFVVRERDGAWR